MKIRNKDLLENLPLDIWENFLEAQRWYGDKGRILTRTKIADVTDLGNSVFWVLLELSYRDGPSRRYHLPNLVLQEDGILVEKPLETSFLTWMEQGFIRGNQLLEKGQVFFKTIETGKSSRFPECLTQSAASVIKGEMSNTLLLIGDVCLVKMYRRIESGRHPEVEAMELLSQSGFPNTPRLFGMLYYAENEEKLQEAPSFLGVASEKIEHADSLWNLFTEDRGVESKKLSEIVKDLGEITAELHMTFFNEETRKIGGDVSDNSYSSIEDQRTDLLKLSSQNLNPTDHLLAREVIDRIEEISGILEKPMDPVNIPIRIHGDFHLGQILYSRKTGQLSILDFEGEPAVDLASRLVKRPAARDVGSFLRSLSYARHCGQGDLKPDIEWENNLREEFLQGYWNKVKGAAFVPKEFSVFVEAVQCEELKKALAEIQYEMTHRPDWISVPLRGVLEILEKIKWKTHKND